MLLSHKDTLRASIPNLIDTVIYTSAAVPGPDTDIANTAILVDAIPLNATPDALKREDTVIVKDRHARREKLRRRHGSSSSQDSSDSGSSDSDDENRFHLSHRELREVQRLGRYSSNSSDSRYSSIERRARGRSVVVCASQCNVSRINRAGGISI